MPRARTPTSILMARGNPKAKHRLADEAQPRRRKPKPPAHLTEAARREWDRMVKLLFPLGLLTEADGDQLSLYCVACARWSEAETLIAAEGLTVESPNHYKIAHPALTVANTAMKQMHQYLAKFGMNPADRSRAQVAQVDAPTPKAAPQPALRIAE